MAVVVQADELAEGPRALDLAYRVAEYNAEIDVEDDAVAVVEATPVPPPATVTYEATAYVALCDSGCTGITATGIDVRQSQLYEGKNIIAVDPREIPLWSTVEITLGSGDSFTAVALDTGGAIKGRRIDLLVGNVWEAWDFGRQDVELWIIKEAE